MKILIYTPHPKQSVYTVAPSGCGNATFKKAGEYPVNDEMAAYLLENKSDLFASKQTTTTKVEVPAKVEKPKAVTKPKVKKED